MIKKIIFFTSFFLIFLFLINADSITKTTKLDKNINVEKDETKKDDIKKNKDLKTQEQSKPENIENIFSIYHDSITKATELNNKLELNEKEEIVIEKKEEQKENKNKYYIDLFKDMSSDFFYNTNNEKESTMIIFKDNTNSKIPSIDEEFETNLLSERKNKFKSKNFIPLTIDDIEKYTPDYNYDSNNIIKTSGKTINNQLGEKIFFKAYKHFKLNNNKNAIQLFNKLVYYNYRLPESYYYISWCFYLQRDYITAINYMKEAVNQGEKSNTAKSIISGYLYQIGNIYLEIENYNNAIIFFTDSIDKAPSLINIYNKLGISYYKIGNLKKALEVWKNGMEKGDKNCANNYNWLINKINK